MSDVTNTGKKRILYLTAGDTPTTNEAAQIAQFQAVTSSGYEVRVISVAENMNYGYGTVQGDYVAHDAATIPTALNAVPVITSTTVPAPLATQETLNSGVTYAAAVSGSGTTHFTPTIVNGVITAIVIS